MVYLIAIGTSVMEKLIKKKMHHIFLCFKSTIRVDVFGKCLKMFEKVNKSTQVQSQTAFSVLVHVNLSSLIQVNFHC